jgi:hypothetical protein
MDAIVRCRTAALGGHRDQCLRCGHQTISYNSCRNRHCPKCQGNARSKCLAARSAELLPVPYFTSFSHYLMNSPRSCLRTSDCFTICSFAPVPQHCSKSPATRSTLGADIGLLCVLHTWGQNLQHHPHVHRVVRLAASR